MEAYWLMNKKKTNFGTFAVLNCGRCGKERQQVPVAYCGNCGAKMLNADDVALADASAKKPEEENGGKT